MSQRLSQNIYSKQWVIPPVFFLELHSVRLSPTSQRCWGVASSVPSQLSPTLAKQQQNVTVRNANSMPFRQRFSHYLPLKQSSRAASRSASLNKDGARSPPKDKEGRESRSARASSSSQASKRRSTMNSREAAYDEAEALRRAIEASKEDAPVLELGDGGSRRAKRVRSDSEE